MDSDLARGLLTMPTIIYMCNNSCNIQCKIFTKKKKKIQCKIYEFDEEKTSDQPIN